MALVRWAVADNVPLTPRGKATSGYGGVLPVKNGVVVDFYRMRQIKNIDAAAMTATVQAGVVWEKLDRELMKKGLTLRLYPSSYPSATVGGWLAQGGAGIGSFASGWFRQNVISARVVMPDGSIKEFRDDELDLISEAEGTTGLISEVTLRVQPWRKWTLSLLGCPAAAGLQNIVQAIIDKNLPVWSVLFINPRMAQLKNEVPLREHLGRPAEERVLLPSAYIVTLAFRKKDRDAVMAPLAEIMKPCQAELLSRRNRPATNGRTALK